MSQRTATTILQDLIRFDTTNPPGNERACIDYLDQLLQSVGIETSILAKDPERPNLSREYLEQEQHQDCFCLAMSTS